MPSVRRFLCPDSPIGMEEHQLSSPRWIAPVGVFRRDSLRPLCAVSGSQLDVPGGDQAGFVGEDGRLGAVAEV
jgi:hypothetical protein